MSIFFNKSLFAFIIFSIIGFLPICADNKKKILILSSTGGGAHAIGAQAIKSYLNNTYNVSIINPVKDIFVEFDPVHKFSWGYLSGESFYNYLLQNNYFYLANQLGHAGKKIFAAHEKELISALVNFLEKNNIDVLISTMPFTNNVALQAAKTLSIPFITIPTDLDDDLYCHDIDNTAAHYNKFIYNIPFNNPILTKRPTPCMIPSDRIRHLGYPLMPDFFAKKDISAIKKHLDMELEKPVIMLIMASQGSDYIVRYSKQLAKLNIPVHIVIVTGKNEELRDQINTIDFGKHISKTIVGFTKDIADLMAISNLIITKSGPNSVMEAVQSGVPVLLHVTGLDWEKFVGKFVTDLHLGEIITSESTLNNQVLDLLKWPKKETQLAALNRNFGSLLNQTISELLV